MAFTMVLAVIGVLICARGIYRCGVREGVEAGASMAVTSLLRDLRDGSVRVEGGVLHVGEGASVRVCDPDGNEVGEIDLGEIGPR